MEVDIQVMADGEFVCLHDDRLDSETDGTGPVAKADSRSIAALRTRGRSGAATGLPPLTLRELVAILLDHAASTAVGAVVQLDLKDDEKALSDATIDRFAELVRPVAQHLSLSGEDWAAVKLLGGGVPGLSLGYDPTNRVRNEDMTVGDLGSWLDHIAATAPEAQMIYPHHSLLAAAAARDIDLVGTLQHQGHKVDCWTIGTDRPGTEAQLRMAVAASVDQVTTDTPGDLQALWGRLADRGG